MKIIYNNECVQNEIILGTVVEDGDDIYMVVFDNLNCSYRFLCLETGIILTDEYDSLEQLFINNKNIIKINSAKLDIKL